MKKNGFTLVELLGVIIIVSLVSLIVMPKITERFNQKQVEASQAAKEILYSATRQYITSNQHLFSTENSYYCVTINDLIADGKLVYPVIDVKTGNTISRNKAIEVSVQNNQYHFNYDSDNCSSYIELIPSVDQSTLTIRIKHYISEANLPIEPYSFDNGLTWQSSKEYTISSYYNNIIKIKDKNGDAISIPLSIGKLTINANGGIWNGLTENSINWLEKDETLNLPDPIKIGYAFTGWTKTGNGEINNKVFTMKTEESELTANWEQNVFTLTINPNGGIWNNTTNNTTYQKEYKSEMTIENPTRTGYTFTGWSIEEQTGSSINGTTFKMGYKNTTITANWQQNLYTLSVNTNDGNWSGTTPQSIPYQATVNIPNPTRTNYIFMGWTVSGEGSSISGTTFTMGYQNTTITANWLNAVYDYAFTGSYQAFTAPITGYYKLEVWGAQGGMYQWDGRSFGDQLYKVVGGEGGYSIGAYYMTLGTTIYIYVGGEGLGYNKIDYNDSNPTVIITGHSGYNGGGYNANGGTGGGGATHISTVNSILSGLSNNTSAVLIVAGGGGGAAFHREHFYSGDYTGNGGIGGGTNGGNGRNFGAVYSNGIGASQTGGGCGSECCGNACGTFGQGSQTSLIVGAENYGGGGWYGGSQGEHAPGGGGSGYIGGVVSANGIEKATYSGYRTGDGYARITYIG